MLTIIYNISISIFDSKRKNNSNRLDKEKLYWLAPGSGRYVFKGLNFQNKASVAYNLSLEAISHEYNNRPYSSKKKWREIYGTKFPA